MLFLFHVNLSGRLFSQRRDNGYLAGCVRDMSRQMKNTKYQSSYCSSSFALRLYSVLPTAMFTWLFRCCVFYRPTYLCMRHSTYTTSAPKFATLTYLMDRITRWASISFLNIVWLADQFLPKTTWLMCANLPGNKLWRKRSQCSYETDNGHEYVLQDTESAKFSQGHRDKLSSALWVR